MTDIMAARCSIVFVSVTAHKPVLRNCGVNDGDRRAYLRRDGVGMGRQYDL